MAVVSVAPVVLLVALPVALVVLLAVPPVALVVRPPVDRWVARVAQVAR